MKSPADSTIPLKTLVVGKRGGSHMWFRTPLDWCSAAFHPARTLPPNGSARAIAVLCPSLGIEHARGRRAFRHLAARLSNEGTATLRIDFPDQADSVVTRFGIESDADLLVERWTSAITKGIELLTELQPSAPIVLIGRRLGALLAANVAHSDPTVDRLIMWDACPSGSLFLREMRLLNAVRANEPDESGKDTPVIPRAVEAVGYRFSDQLMTAIDSLSLSKVKPRRGLHVTSVQSADMGRVASALNAWVDEGVYVDRHVVDDAKFDPDGWRTTALPHNTFRIIVSSLAELPIAKRALVSAPAAVNMHTPSRLLDTINFEWQRPDGVVSQLTERIVRLGGEANDRLVGRITEPFTNPKRQLGVVLLRALGGSGANVLLSRKWAARGATVLRVDVSGSDESEPRPGEPENDPYPKYGAEDVGEIVTWYRSQLSDSATIAVVGECADAYFAVHAAARGVPIDDVIAVNPQLYWNGSFDVDFSEIAHLSVPNVEVNRPGRLKRLQQLFKHSDWPQRLRRASRNRYARLRRSLKRQTDHNESEEPTFTKLIRLDIPALFPRTVRWHLVFSQGDPGLQHLYAHGRPAIDRLQSQPGFTLTIAPTNEHLFLKQKDRQWLDDFMTSCLPFDQSPTTD